MKHPILLSLMSLALSAALPAMAQTAAPAAAPAGSTGQCKDGSYTSASFKMGACRGHKGVQSWFGSTEAKPAKPAKSTTAAAKPAVAPAPAPAAAPAAAPARPAPMATTTPAPAPVPTARAPRAMPAPGPVAAGGGNGQVWVNMKTKVYHCQGDRWYGTSKDGQYMSESAATAAGARPSRGKTCSAR